MVTYYFDITMDGKSSKDTVGYRFLTKDGAQIEATKIAAELIFDQLADGVERDFGISIVNASGCPCGGFMTRFGSITIH